MKRLFFVFGVIIFCLFICEFSMAETVGNPADIHLPPGRGVYSAQLGDFITLNAGFDTEFLTEKNFDHANEGSTSPKLEGVYYMGRLSCTLFDRIQPYIKVGVADLEMSWKNGSSLVKAEGGIAPSWGMGLKAYLWEFEGVGLKIFSTASFRSTKPDKIRSVNVGGTSGNITQKKFEIFERQATIGVSREFEIPGYQDASIVPYAGVAWSDTTARVRFTQGTNVVNSGAKGQDLNIGLFFGADFIVLDNFSLNAEIRLIDQTGGSLGLTALF